MAFRVIQKIKCVKNNFFWTDMWYIYQDPCSQSNYKGGNWSWWFLNFFGWKLIFRWLWSALLDSWGSHTSLDTFLANMWHIYGGLVNYFLYHSKTKLVRCMGMSFSLSTSNGPSLNNLIYVACLQDWCLKKRLNLRNPIKHPNSHLFST